MTYHLFGNLLTSNAPAANNRGETEGICSTLQKIYWQGQLHTVVSSEAIRWALRYQWQERSYKVNRIWDDLDNALRWSDPSFDPTAYIDDDVLGYMLATKPKDGGTSDANAGETEGVRPEASGGRGKGKQRAKPKGTALVRRGALDVNRAVSLTPWSGDVTFNARSGREKDNTSLYATEVHATAYQFPFAISPGHLVNPERVLPVMEGLTSLSEVAGNHARFSYDFSPVSLVLRWTHDFCPRFQYCFESDERGIVSAPELVRRVKAGDLEATELWIGGRIVADPEVAELADLGVNLFPGVLATTKDLQRRIQADLGLKIKEVVQC